MKHFCPCSHPKNMHKNGVCMVLINPFQKCPCGKPKQRDIFRLSNMIDFHTPDISIEILEFGPVDE